MSRRTYTIGEVARTLGLEGKNSSTVRLWTETFADWLSPLTRPVKGQSRLYTEEDVKSLALIRDLRRQHLSYDEVRGRLSARKVTAPEPAAGVVAELAPAEATADAMVEIAELRGLLSPVFEVSEALRRFLGESDYSVGIHLELGRIASSVETLNAKLDLLRYDLETLRGDLKPVRPSQARGTAGGAEKGAQSLDAYDEPRAPRVEPASAGHAGGGGPAPAVAAAPESPAQHPARAARTPEGEAEAPAGLNEFGLRPLPRWLAEHSPAAFRLCRRCGSTTRPLGVTPTSRVVLLCIQCQERLAVPLDRLQKELGARRGFWTGLCQILRHPFSRRGR